MTDTGAFVAGDWGTSHLRLYLCAANGSLLDTVTGPGAATVRGSWPELMTLLLAPWERERGPLPCILSGMVGSSIGWTTVPYVRCPARPEQVAAGALGIAGSRVHIVPGLSCRNRLGAPDVLRGEETQILGALRLHAPLQQGQQLLCLPGTHTKWVVLEDGAVRDFITAPTGELFAALSEHSILVHESRPAAETEISAQHPAFNQGLEEFRRCPQAGLLHRLFECRSRRLSGEFSGADPASFLSGLLVAADVHGAMTLLNDGAVNAVTIVGATQLSSLYARALEVAGYRAVPVSGEAAAREGLVSLQRLLSEYGAVHAA